MSELLSSHQTDSVCILERGWKSKWQSLQWYYAIQNGQTHYKELIKEDLTWLRSGQHNDKGNGIAKLQSSAYSKKFGYHTVRVPWDQLITAQCQAQGRQH